MVTLMVGVLLVAVGAAVFGFALFGRRPLPQPAMSLAGSHLDGPAAEPPPSIPVSTGADAGATAASSGFDDLLPAGWLRRLLQREPSAAHQPEADVTLSGWVRVRSALYLTLVVTGLAALIGIVASVLVVGLVLLIT